MSSRSPAGPLTPLRAGWRGRRVGLVFFAAFLGAAPAFGAEGLAPLRAKNLNPLHLVFLQPSAELPSAGPGGRVDLAYATVFVSERGGDASVLLDMEVARLAVTGAGRLPWGGVVSLEVPFLWYGRGAFDGILNGYHGASGLGDGGRSARPENTFAYEMRKGADAYSPDPPASGGLGDLVLSAVHPVGGVRSGQPRAAVRWCVKLPTGSVRDGFGRGRADAGAGLLGTWGRARAGLTANADLVYRGGTPNAALKLRTPWVLSSLLSLGLDLGFLGIVSAQLRFSTPPYDTGLRPLDSPVLLLAAGLRRQFSNRVWASLGFTEDLVVETSPDLSLFAGIEW